MEFKTEGIESPSHHRTTFMHRFSAVVVKVSVFDMLMEKSFVTGKRIFNMVKLNHEIAGY